MSEPASPTADPAIRPHHTFTHGEVVRIIAAAAVAGAAIGYLVAHFGGDTLNILARIFAIVAMMTVLTLIIEARRRRQFEGVRERLERMETTLAGHLDAELAGYNRGYMDCLKDRNSH